MRIRRKKWARPELAQSAYFVPQPQQYKNHWRQQFAKKAPLHAEFGCGKGISLADMAIQNPDINYIGVDISMDMLGVARRNIQSAFQDREVTNVLLTSWNLEYVDEIFGCSDSIERLYIYFCNPWSRPRHHKRRLTHQRQLNQYLHFLSPDGEMYFKTDDDDLFRDSLRSCAQSGFSVLYKTNDLYRSAWQHRTAPSEHEIKFTQQGIPIKFAVFKRNDKMNERM